MLCPPLGAQPGELNEQAAPWSASRISPGLGPLCWGLCDLFWAAVKCSAGCLGSRLSMTLA